MNAIDKEKLLTALGITEPLPLPNSQAEEVLLEERRLASIDLPPTARRSEKDVARINQILDEIFTGKDTK